VRYKCRRLSLRSVNSKLNAPVRDNSRAVGVEDRLEDGAGSAVLGGVDVDYYLLDIYCILEVRETYKHCT
jgi:hypothetical protein